MERERARRSELCDWTSLLQMCVVMHGGVREGGSSRGSSPRACLSTDLGLVIRQILHHNRSDRSERLCLLRCR